MNTAVDGASSSRIANKYRYYYTSIESNAKDEKCAESLYQRKALRINPRRCWRHLELPSGVQSFPAAKRLNQVGNVKKKKNSKRDLPM